MRAATAAGAIALLVAGAVAAALAPGGGRAEPSRTRVHKGDLTLLLPAGWETRHSAAGRLGPLTDQTTAAPAEGGATLLAAVMREPGETVGTLRQLAPEPATPVATRLGTLEASAYQGLRPRPGSTSTAYLLNTTGPSVLVLCSASGDARAKALRACAAAAATVRLSGETPLTVRAAAGRRRAVRRAVAQLGVTRIADRDRIAAAATTEELADAGLDLQVSYYEASRGIQATRLPGMAARRLVAGLARTGDAYGALAAAVIAGDQAAYDTARAGVLAREAALWDQLPPRTVRLFADQP